MLPFNVISIMSIPEIVLSSETKKFKEAKMKRGLTLPKKMLIKLQTVSGTLNND